MDRIKNRSGPRNVHDVLPWHVKDLTSGNEFPLGNIGNMDETPIFFDMIGNRTVDSKGTRFNLVKSTGHERTHFTVVLSCLANGMNLKPMVIFKRKRMPKENFPSGAFVHFHEKGWMDEQGVRLWIDNIWRKRPGHRNSRSLLLWDSFRSDVSEAIKSHLNKCKIKTAVIPGGLTSVLQPLDVCINKPFKDYMREEWKEWMANGQKMYTAGGRMRAPSLSLLCQFVIKAWSKVKTETVIKSFQKCSISALLENTEDDQLPNSDQDRC